MGIRTLFWTEMLRQAERRVAPGYRVMLEYPVDPVPRYGDGKPPHPELSALIASGDGRYAATLRDIARFEPGLAAIAEAPARDAPGEPHWANNFFSALDAIALYGLLGTLRPRRYLEVGSGNSTKFARRAIRDLALGTRVTSIDPAPRAGIDGLCDEVIRAPLETVDPAVFAGLAAGDFVFVDSSHRVFTNSDVTVFFLEILPRLNAGIVLHIHDVFLPFDYPRAWSGRHYSEQYLLAAYLLTGHRRLEVVLPLAYVDRHPQLGELVRESWHRDLFLRSCASYRGPAGGYAGTSFWLRTV